VTYQKNIPYFKNAFFTPDAYSASKVSRYDREAATTPRKGAGKK